MRRGALALTAVTCGQRNLAIILLGKTYDKLGQFRLSITGLLPIIRVRVYGCGILAQHLTCCFTPRNEATLRIILCICRDEEGATMVECGLLVALIAMGGPRGRHYPRQPECGYLSRVPSVAPSINRDLQQGEVDSRFSAGALEQ